MGGTPQDRAVRIMLVRLKRIFVRAPERREVWTSRYISRWIALENNMRGTVSPRIPRYPAIDTQLRKDIEETVDAVQPAGQRRHRSLAGGRPGGTLSDHSSRRQRSALKIEGKHLGIEMPVTGSIVGGGVYLYRNLCGCGSRVKRFSGIHGHLKINLGIEIMNLSAARRWWRQVRGEARVLHVLDDNSMCVQLMIQLRANICPGRRR